MELLLYTLKEFDKNESTIEDDWIKSNDAKRKLKGGFKKLMSERTIMTFRNK
ncbi:hypothetical protein QJS10_CPB11g01677 [Acorus calamus]|uniref:Uncharacterized protein n=1 Tax=Acorus calamus TaxID=4465 RepID=A0AAV9DUP4_ACOCL|nr:hypothetical protein QJS10_CPB11g01677 [Acorus calamus]